MSGPSLHLSWSELACKDGTEYPREWRLMRAVVLARAFEHVRAICGHRPIPILSGYRTPAHNRKVGGAKFSQHTQGRALDMRPPAGLALDEFYDIITRIAHGRRDLGIRGLGLYPSFVHMDVREGERIAVWGGKRPLAEMT